MRERPPKQKKRNLDAGREKSRGKSRRNSGDGGASASKGRVKRRPCRFKGPHDLGEGTAGCLYVEPTKRDRANIHIA